MATFTERKAGIAASLAEAAPGSCFAISRVGSNWVDASGATITARPTTRTDLTMVVKNTVDATSPSFALTGDVVLALPS